MLFNKLVDRLNIHGDLNTKDLYKNYIFRKHTTYLFNNIKLLELGIFNWIYIDIWGPTLVQLARGIIYFMILIDRFSFYCTMSFLSNKSADTTKDF